MTAIITLIYALTAAILVLGAFIGYKRGFGRASVRLAYLAIIAVASFFIAQSISDSVAATLLEFARTFYNDTVNEVVKANPQLEVIVQSLATALLTPIIFAIFFGLVQLITLICFKLISTKIVGLFKKELAPKTSKWLGAAVGLVSSVVMIFALFAPITFAASVLANTPVETLELLDEAFFSEEETDDTTVVYATPNGQLKKDDNNGNHYGQRKNDISVKKLRNALVVFTLLSNDYKIVGSEQSAQRELSNVIAAAGDGIASFKASIEDNPNDSVSAYLNVVAAVGANTEHSQFISTVVKEASKAVAKMDSESVTKALSSVTAHAETIGSIVPQLSGIFTEIAESSDKELTETIQLWFGEPPVEPSRTKELREKEEKKNQGKPSDNDVSDAPATNAPETPAPETKVPEAPETAKPSDDTTNTVDTTDATETTVVPETTVAPDTTIAPETTAAPETETNPEEQKSTQNTGLIGSLISGGSVADKGEQLSKDVELFNLIKSTVLGMLSSGFDITTEEYAWIYGLIRSGLNSYLNEVQSNPSMTYVQKVEYLADALAAGVEENLPPKAYETPGIDWLLKPASMQVVAIFSVDTFTLEAYPDKDIPLEDIMNFMGIYDIPDWVEE